jgi:hypothetical protein
MVKKKEIKGKWHQAPTFGYACPKSHLPVQQADCEKCPNFRALGFGYISCWIPEN